MSDQTGVFLTEYTGKEVGKGGVALALSVRWKFCVPGAHDVRRDKSVGRWRVDCKRRAVLGHLIEKRNER